MTVNKFILATFAAAAAVCVAGLALSPHEPPAKAKAEEWVQQYESTPEWACSVRAAWADLAAQSYLQAHMKDEYSRWRLISLSEERGYCPPKPAEAG